MTAALTVTGNDLIRALGAAAALPAVDDAVKARAEALAAELAGDGVTTRVLQRGAGAYTVEVTGEGLFEQEFGTQGDEPNPIIGAAIAKAASP